MPDDCGDIEKRYYEKLNKYLDNIPDMFKRVCSYCRTDPKKDVCVNCGAPQTMEGD